MAELVSIITPAYKAAGYIEKAITSVQQQTYPHWELIVADDCSPDDTGRIVARYAEQDPRVKLVVQPVNQGPAMARNASLGKAQGRFIAFLDSDDWWLPRKLELQLDFAGRSGAALTYTQFKRVDQDGNNEGRLMKVPDRLTYRMLLGNTAIATSTAMVDRKQTGDFRMTKTYYDDFALWLKLLRAGHVANALHEDLMRYRVLKGSVSRSKVNSAKKVWSTYREIEGLGIASSSVYFSMYACNALLKYLRF
ncbi:glycosyltransferase family 2 protein [Bradyrhizobium sp. CB2312]|uniref:glycosyltransferase family 2 protein n=1 Tax=Bradyrhizobium sp. CB2312 TaxID=3039155 RepID=UPI0024B1975A|nr:glycosyltransferase family 2 protein [Bradyrhizobium sp. CB2312]WFU75662.1 glycosyltransferase family 2 protein [Bradyrhizobium sp. CB2312]